MRFFLVAVVLVASLAWGLTAANDTFAQADYLAPLFPAVLQLEKDPHKALVALDREIQQRGQPVAIEAMVLRAHLLSAAQRYNDSVNGWDEVAARDDDMRDFAARSAIADLLAAHRADEALVRIRGLSGRLSPGDDDSLLLGAADVLLDSRQPDKALQLYDEVLQRSTPARVRRARTRSAQIVATAAGDRARLGVARAEEAAGRSDAALRAWHDATVIWRSADTYSTARTAEQRLAGRLGRQTVPLTRDQYFAVAGRLTSASRFDDAIALLNEGKRSGIVPDDGQVEAEVISNLYRGRHNEEAMSRAEKLIARLGPGKAAANMKLLQIRLCIRTGDLAQARKRLTAMQGDASVPTPIKQSAQRAVAAQLVVSGPVREAISIYRTLLKARLPRGDRYDLSWRAGMALVREGDNAAALSMFAQAKKLAPRGTTPRSVLYWHGVVQERLGKADAARGTWKDIVDANAFDYYGLRATERLKGAAPTASFAFPSIDVSAPLRESPGFRTATILARAGLGADAASALHTLADRFRTDYGLALLAARAAYKDQDYATAWSLVATRFATYLAHPASDVPPDIWQMAFPLAYWEEVQPVARREGVDPLLLLSLMRRESRFIVSARSRTGAVGLFQIMAYTAAELAQAPQEPVEGETLLDAPSSADLAARLVKRIMSHFPGAVAPVVASYNAGEDRVADWWRGVGNLPEDLFVDLIPYGETRMYVREVLANYAIYKRLYPGR